MDKRRFIAVDTKLVDTLVGAAIRGVVQGGADDAYVASFSASYRAQVQQLLGVAAPAEAAQPPDLLELVTQAVEQALNGRQAAAATPPRAAAVAPTERINVRVNGKRTSLTIKTELLARARLSLGGRQKALATISELAASAPELAANRSGWVQQRLEMLMQAPGAAPGVSH